MFSVRLSDYKAIEFEYHTGINYLLLTRYEYEGCTWELKVTGLRRMEDAFTVSDIGGQILAVTHRDLIQGELGEFVNEQVNKHLKLFT